MPVLDLIHLEHWGTHNRQMKQLMYEKRVTENMVYCDFPVKLRERVNGGRTTLTVCFLRDRDVRKDADWVGEGESQVGVNEEWACSGWRAWYMYTGCGQRGRG
jgi:hypothetical protein